MSISREHTASRPRLTEAPGRPLLALRGATAASQVGLPPHCAATVRVLDRVYFSVGAGDCVVVQHRDPARVRVLLAALAGHIPNATLRLHGTRTIRAGVRVRRTSIRADLVPTLIAAWRSRPFPHTSPHRSSHASSLAPVVHLLRASRGGSSAGADHRAWSAWAAAQRAVGGALVIVADGEAPGVPQSPATPPRAAPTMHDGREVHEPSPPYRPATDDEARTAGAVRACRFRHGRIAFAPEAVYCWPSEAPVVLGP
ncbi:MAG: hypothetical protein K2R93_17060 [Gemmatimonadaceae bacterium]|nr:hypothetical protein [Gemmatimonadaceae bacterium]